jgi:hypothetical protein
MKRGAILETARKDTAGAFLGGVILIVLCAGTVAIKWKYVYNVIAGPGSFIAVVGAWDSNLFALAAVLLLPFALLVAVSAARIRMDLQRHHEIARLTRYGNPMDVIALIETELSSTRVAAYVSPLWLGSTWVVALTPQLRIYKLSDIVAVASIVTPSKDSKPTKHAVRFWVDGHTLADTMEMNESEARAVMAALATKLPGVVTNDADAFGKRWLRDPDACMRDAKTRRLPRSA